MIFPWIEHLTQMFIGLINACGPSVVAMLLNMYFRHRRVSVREVAQKVGNGTGFSTFWGLDIGSTSLGLPLTYYSGISLAWIAERLRLGYPVIVLVAYVAFSDRPYGYTSAHFVLVIGITETHVIAYDPLRPNGPTYFPRAEFDVAINMNSRYPRTPTIDNPSKWGYNSPRQAMIPDFPLGPDEYLLADMRRLLEKR